MKVKLAPNAELDTLTQEELAEVLDRKLSGFSRPAEPYRDFNTTALDANGNSGIPGAANNPNPVSLFEPPPGFTWALHRLKIQAEGQTFGATYPGGYIYVLRAGRLEEFVDLGLGLPAVITYTSDAPIYNNGETISILVSGGPASTVLVVDMQVTIEPTPGVLVEV